MTAWHPELLVYVNDRYDQENASDRISRYGAYLRQRTDQFRDAWSDTPAPIEDPGEFAVNAWRVATAPVMVPGYAQTRPDLHAVTLHRDEDDHGLYADIHVPLRHMHIGGDAKRFPYSWQDWDAERDHRDDDFPVLLMPRSTKKPSILATAVVRVSGREWPHLVTPTAHDGPRLLDEARETVTTVAHHINTDAGPIVAKLLA
ncbi:hypothetical protein AB0G67_40405 [Streptomyces sp. NPDC021056]|uniref:hypothetical protein n=1 Tax=Streptomyces sp. NPDC021056 TaxID=3155012 RepID=UPI0033D360AD